MRGSVVGGGDLMAQRELPVTPHRKAYGRLRRVKDAYRFIRDRSREGSAALERTQARFVADTYGIETALVRRMKARFRTELSFQEGK
jgi:hypothetical protein